jgi:hypothetical protein
VAFTLLELVVLEILGVLDAGFRHHAWRFFLQATCLLLVVLLPLNFFMIISGGWNPATWLSHARRALTYWLLFLVFFARIAQITSVWGAPPPRQGASPARAAQ